MRSVLNGITAHVPQRRGGNLYQRDSGSNVCPALRRCKQILRTAATCAVAVSIASGCATTGKADRDIRRISDSLCRSDIVLLGELPSHGEAKAFAWKASVVGELVGGCGFDAVLFEAPIYDFVGLQSALTAESAEPAMLDNAIGRFWLTEELAPFRAWLYEEARARRLVIGGLDDQVSITSQYARARLPELMSSPACRVTARRNLQWSYSDSLPFDAAEKQRLQQCAAPGRSGSVLLRNFHTYVERQAETPNAASRDEVMRDNLLWYRTQLPRGTRIIVWTATTHAARKQGDMRSKPLGAYLAEVGGMRVTAIGITALAGESSMAARPVRQLPALPANALEAQVATGDAEWTYLDRPRLQQIGTVPSRLLGTIVSADWSEYFDGVVVIRDETAPTFKPWPQP
jgi:erythromycin esterase-like protein